MKNTLAENLLRFGVKNLKESDKKKLSEAVLTEAFQKNYWIDSITKGGMDNAAEYVVNVTGNFAAKLGFEVQRNALMGPWNQELITVQIMPGMLANIKTIQDLDKYLSTPNNIQTMTLSTGKGDFQNEKAVAKLKTIKSYYKGVNPQTNKPFEYGVNVNPNTLYQMLLESLMGALGRA